MIYSFLANFILVIHICYVFFVIFGGLLLFRWRGIWKIHLPAVVWGFLVQYFVWICPLTTWENYFRDLSGEVGYTDGFINYFLTTLLYPNINPEIHTVLAILVVLINIGIYYLVFRQKQN